MPDAGLGKIHVLIVGVGRYDGGENGSLPGVAAAVRRIAEWWRGADERLLDGRRMGTVVTLISDDGSVAEQAPDPNVKEPTLSNVRSAIQRWIRDCRNAGKEGMGFLFWVGHGTAAGSAQAPPSHALFCMDWNAEDPEAGFQEGIDWNKTLDAINASSGDARIFCFVDSCRTEPFERRTYRSAIDAHRADAEPAAFVLRSARSNRKGWAIDEAHEPSGFPGGPLMTCALLNALGRYGAFARDPALGHFSTPNLVTQAVRHQMKRWAEWIAAEKGVAAPTIRLDPIQGDWFDEPILKVAAPESMLDVTPAAGTSIADFECRVRCAGASMVSLVTPRRWEIDIARKATAVEVLRNADNETMLTVGFHASHAFHSLTVPG